MDSIRLLDSNDEFHSPDEPSPWVTETAWYSFWTPGHEFAVHVYLRFRLNIGIANSCVYAWEPGVCVPWEAPYWKHLHVPLPDSLVDMELLGGLRHRQREPFRAYDISYSDNRGYGSPFSFDIAVDALDEPQYFGGKHFDQEVRVRGRLEISGQTFDIDCLAMRDRSWYRRGDFTLFRSAYAYAVAPGGDTFLALYAAPRDQDLLVDDLPLVGGHVVADGQRTALSRGRRRVVSRDPATGQPREVEVEAADDRGRPVRAHGVVIGSIALAANPNMMSWMNLVRWTVNGSTVVGEDQEIWSPSIWRAFRRGSRP